MRDRNLPHIRRVLAHVQHSGSPGTSQLDAIGSDEKVSVISLDQVGMIESTEQSAKRNSDLHKQPMEAVDQFLDLLARLIARQHLRKQAETNAQVGRRDSHNQQRK